MSEAPVGEILTRLTGTAPQNDVAAISAQPGAYLLQLVCDTAVPIAIATLPATTLPAGVYVYAGSARGPGGMRARIGRHLRRDKSPHWHIDHLSAAASAVTAYPVACGDECRLVTRLLESGFFATPLPGFGSSDCRQCASHLLFHASN